MNAPAAPLEITVPQGRRAPDIVNVTETAETSHESGTVSWDTLPRWTDSLRTAPVGRIDGTAGLASDAGAGASGRARRDIEAVRCGPSTMVKGERGVSQMENFKMKWFGCVLSAALIGAVMIPAGESAAQGLSIKEKLAAQREAAASKSTTRTESTRGFSVIKRDTVVPSAKVAADTPKRTSPGVSVATAPAMAKAATASTTQTAAAAPSITPDAPTVTAASVKRIATKDSLGEDITVNVFASEAGVDISEPVRFEYNSAFLTAEGRDALTVYCSAIKEFESDSENAGGSYVLIGHADASGDARYNKVLSQKRAEESRRFMVESCGLPGDKVRAVGLGEEALKDPNNPNSAENRRVELQFGS
jgi:outer membrane protein OmpA-like peptidoglycan-associated protein